MRSLIHFGKYLLGIDSPASQVTERELALLLKYSIDAKVIVEIGCYEGKTSVALAQATPELEKLYSIDPFFKGRLGICYGEWIAKLHRRRHGLNKIEFTKGLSHEVAPAFQRQIDFLFIDADHRYEAIKQDWHDWLPKIRSGGVIALHDAKPAINSPDYLGSMQFYEQDVRPMQGIKEIDSIDSLVVLEVVR